VRQAKGILLLITFCMAYSVCGMGTLPLTSTPSISEIIIGLKVLDFFNYNDISICALLKIYEVPFELITIPYF
jgi:hypothetical protein